MIGFGLLGPALRAALTRFFLAGWADDLAIGLIRRRAMRKSTDDRS